MRLFCIHAVVGLSLSIASMGLADHHHHPKVFNQISEFMVGTWTPADQESKDGPVKHVYSFAVDKRFVHVDAQHDPLPWIGVMGIESKSQKLAWWGFFSDGSAGAAYLVESTDSEWVFAGEGLGPDGKTHRRVTVTKTGDASLHAKIEDTTDDDETTIQESDWVRHR